MSDFFEKNLNNPEERHIYIDYEIYLLLFELIAFYSSYHIPFVILILIDNK